MSATSCCCPTGDARSCYELRYYGRSPVLDRERDDRDDVCECACHGEEEEHDDEHETEYW